MNKARREMLREALQLLHSVLIVVNKVSDKEQDVVDNYPENLQYTEVYESMENAAENLSEAIGKLNEAEAYIAAAMERA
jgi:hypothetical protein